MKRVQSWLGALWRRIDPDARDAHAYAGMALLAWGLASWPQPNVAASVVGLMLFYLAIRRA